MQKNYLIINVALLCLHGCAGSTTDPRQGGLFSYNPDAYEQRLSDRDQELSAIQSDTSAQEDKSAQLHNELSREKNKMH